MKTSIRIMETSEYLPGRTVRARIAYHKRQGAYFLHVEPIQKTEKGDVVGIHGEREVLKRDLFDPRVLEGIANSFRVGENAVHVEEQINQVVERERVEHRKAVKNV